MRRNFIANASLRYADFTLTTFGRTEPLAAKSARENTLLIYRRGSAARGLWARAD